MARESRGSPREPVTLVPLNPTLDDPDLGEMLNEERDDRDSDLAWVGWIDALKESGGKGKITAYRLPNDAEGNPSTTSKGQVYLGHWPHDQYTLEELCEFIRRKFLRPGETAGIRLIGSQAGTRGLRFNKIVMMARASDESEGSSSQLADVLAVIQQSQLQQQEFIRSVVAGNQPPPPEKVTPFDWKSLIGPLTPLLLPIITRIVTPAAPPPGTSMKEMIETIVALKGLMGEGGSDESDSTASIIKAVAPGGLQVLAQLMANANKAPPVVARRLPAPTRDLSAPSRVPVAATTVGASATSDPPREVQNTAPAGEILTTPTASQPALSLTPEQEAVMKQFIEQLEALAPAADENQDPSAVAKAVVPMLPHHDEKAMDAIFEKITDPATMNYLCVVSSKIRERREWFERLRLALELELAEPDDVTVEGSPDPA